MTNPFNQKSKALCDYFMDWQKINAKPYDKNKAEPFTKVRVILMNGTEFEANWFLHQLARHTKDNDIRRQVALVRAQEQQQQKRIASLKPIDESILENTIAYEQLAVELTAILAQNDTDENNIKSLNFALLEDFDHLYRFSNLLKMDYNIESERLVGGYTEIMPGRPTIAHHRFPSDNIKPPLNSKNADLYTILVSSIITAAEQQTMNYYMNQATFYKNEYGRKMFTEIGLVEEEHVSQYESLKDPTLTWLECWVMHEYTECYLYYSMMQDEVDEYIKNIYAEHYEMEVTHLKTASECLMKYENTDYKKILPDPNFPKLLKFGGNIEYIRKVLETTITLTNQKEDYIDVSKLDQSSDFALFQKWICPMSAEEPAHVVTDMAIKKFGEDYRYTVAPYPVKELADRKCDNTEIARPKGCK